MKLTKVTINSPDILFFFGELLVIAIGGFYGFKVGARDSSLKAFDKVNKNTNGEHKVQGKPYEKNGSKGLNAHNDQELTLPLEDQKLTVKTSGGLTTFTIEGVFPAFYYLHLKTRAYGEHDLRFDDLDFETYWRTHSNAPQIAKEILSEQLRRSLIPMNGYYQFKIEDGALWAQRNHIEAEADRLQEVIKIFSTFLKQQKALLHRLESLAQSLGGKLISTESAAPTLTFSVESRELVMTFERDEQHPQKASKTKLQHQHTKPLPPQQITRQSNRNPEEETKFPETFWKLFDELPTESITIEEDRVTVFLQDALLEKDILQRAASLFEYLLPPVDQEPYR
jgi:hypothetical protein